MYLNLVCRINCFNLSNRFRFFFFFFFCWFLQLAPILLRLIEACAPLIIESKQNDMLTYVIEKQKKEKKEEYYNLFLFFLQNFSLLESELSSYLNLHPPIAKRALYCMCALNCDKKDEILQNIIDVIKMMKKN